MVPRIISSVILAAISASATPLAKRNPYSFVLNNPYGDTIFELGNVSYLANTKHPKTAIAADCGATTAVVPITVIKTNETTISRNTLESAISSYLSSDDVFNKDFLDGLLISSPAKASLDSSALEYLNSISSSFIFVGHGVGAKGIFSTISLDSPVELPAGPYLVSKVVIKISRFHFEHGSDGTTSLLICDHF